MYDVIVIGGGAAGLTVSIGLAKFKKKVLLIDKKEFGGECTWAGCIPSKSFIELAHRVYDNPTLYKKEDILPQVNKIIAEVYSHEDDKALEEYGIEVLHGDAVISGENQVTVSNTIYSGKNIVICTGGKTFVPPIPGLKEVSYLTNENFFHQESIGESYTLIGGGVISLELAVPLSKLGAKVTILEKSEKFLPLEDEEVSQFYVRHLEESGVKLVLGVNISEVKNLENRENLESPKNLENREIKNSQKVVIKTDKGDFISERVFVSAGRTPNLDILKGSNVNIESTPKGISVDSHLETTTKGIYSVGDVVGPYRFSHMCEYQGETVIRNILFPYLKKSVEYTSVPFTIFSRPEYGRTGLTFREAKLKYGEKLKRFEITTNDRSIITFEKDFKVVAYTVNDKIVGAFCIGNRAGEIIASLQIVKNNNLPLSSLTKGIQAYPTYGSVLRKLGKLAMADKYITLGNKIINNKLVKGVMRCLKIK